MTPLKFLKQCLPLWVKQAVATTHNYITISNNLLYIQLKNRIHRKGKVTIGRKTILKNLCVVINVLKSVKSDGAAFLME